MEKLNSNTYEELFNGIVKRCYSTVYYSRNIDIIPNLLDMGLLSREDVAQEFILAILNKAGIPEQGQPIINALKQLETALKTNETQVINRNVKFLMLYNSYTVINTVTRNHGIKKAQEPIDEPYINDREQLGLTHLFSEYSIDKANENTRRAITKRMDGEPLTVTERQALSRFVRQFKKENQ